MLTSKSCLRLIRSSLSPSPFHPRCDLQMFLEPLSDMLNLQASDHPRCVQWTYAHAAVGKATSASAVAAAGAYMLQLCTCCLYVPAVISGRD